MFSFRFMILVLFNLAWTIKSLNSQSFAANKDICVKSASAQDKPCLHKEYSYECDSTKCALNQEACDNFKSTSFTLRVYKYSNNYHSQKYKSFLSQLKPCPATTPFIQIEFNGNDVCNNNNSTKCKRNEYTDRLVTLFGFFKLSNKCACSTSKHTFACGGTDVCALNKNACDAYLRSKFKLNKQQYCK